jgi:phage I-like protein
VIQRFLTSSLLIACSAAVASEFVIGAGTEIAPSAEGPPKRVKLLPIGEVTLRDGRGPFLIADRAHAEEIVAATRRFLAGVDLMFDYDHQALYAVKPGVGGTAIAAGWAKTVSLEVEDDGIYADVEWTEAAAAKIGAREYRYLSPAFAADKTTMRVQRLTNAALVNIPALTDPSAIAAGHQPGEDMDLSKITGPLGLGSDASVDAIAAAIVDLKTKPLATIAAAVDLSATATVEEIAAAVTTIKSAAPDPAKFVPVEQVTQLTQQLGVLNEERAERAITAAIETGKLVPALKDWGLSLFKKDEAGWATWLAAAPTIVAAGAQIVTGQLDKDGKATLTEEQVAAAAMLNMSADEYREALKLETA